MARSPFLVIVAARDAATRERLVGKLARIGCWAMAVADGEQLMQASRTVHPDLVVVEAELGGLGSIEAAEALRYERDLPVILLFDRFNSHLVSQAVRTANVMSLQAKPVPEEKLQAVVSLSMARSREARRLEEEAAALLKALGERAVLEKSNGSDVPAPPQEGGSEPATHSERRGRERRYSGWRQRVIQAGQKSQRRSPPGPPDAPQA